MKIQFLKVLMILNNYMKTILITGATGFVGKQVIKVLSKSKVNIVPVVRSTKENIFEGITNIKRVIHSPNIFQEDEDWWKNQCNGIDTIIHIAWYAEPTKYLQSTKNIDCLMGSLNLAKGAVKAGVRRFVGIGTCFEYDLSKGKLSINTALNPSSIYASTKAALYTTLLHWLPKKMVDFSWCRLFYLYGENEDERRLVPYVHRQLSRGEEVELTSGKQIRDYLDVSEVGRMIAEIALSDHKGPINICSGLPISVKELVEDIADQYNRRDLLRFGVRSENLVDPSEVVGIK